MTDLIPWTSVQSIVERYHAARRQVEDAQKLCQSATILMEPITKYWTPEVKNGRNEKNVLDQLRAGVWAHIVDKLGIRQMMSIKKQAEFDHEIYQNNAKNLPEITVETVRGVIMGYATQTRELLDEAIQEVFQFLRPSRRDAARHKTTEKSRNAIQEKIILTSIINDYGSLNYSYRKEINAIDNLFRLLDGKGTAKYPDNLETQLSQAITDKLEHLKTEYFHCKWYIGAGTLHIQFLRPDLLKIFNQRAGKNSNQLPNKGEYYENF